MSSAPGDPDLTKQRKTKMFHEKLAILNDNLIRFVRNAHRKQPSADFTPTVQDYIKHVQELDGMYSGDSAIKPMVSNSATTAASLFSATTTAAPLFSATTTTAPLISTGAPMFSTTTTAAPLFSTAAPMFSATTTAAPLFSTAAPMFSTAAPMFSTTTTTAAPLFSTAAPMFSTTTTTAAPLFSTAAPMFSTAAPMFSTTTAAPLFSTTTTATPLFSAITTAAPLISTAAPMFSTTTTTAAPLFSTAAPMFSTTTTAAQLFSFGGFGNIAPKSVISNSTTTTAPMFSFGTMAAKSLVNQIHNATEEDGDEKPEEFVPKDDIKPLVPLPPEVNLKSGEEDEEMLFEARCKLFRYDSSAKENKDRGIGELKVLRNKETSRCRCLVRSNEAGKLMANFSITAGLNPEKHKKPVVITWSCRDFSEKPNDGTDEIFLAKFRDEETAQQFMTKIGELVKSLGVKK